MGGGSNIEGSARKTKKNASAQGSLKFREVSNSFWEGTRREKNSLKKVSQLLTYLLGQSEQNNNVLLHVVVLFVFFTSF